MTASAVVETKPSASSSDATTTSSSETSPFRDSNQTDTNIWIYICYGTIIACWILSRYIVIPYVLHLLVLVTCILYCACHMSLMLREIPHPDEKDSDGQPIQQEIRETLKKEDAYQFPLIGSVSLFSLYLAFKYLDKDWVNFLIGFYFGLVGCFAITMTIAPAIDKIWNLIVGGPAKVFNWEYKFKHSLPEWIAGPSPFEIGVSVSINEIVSFFISVVICGLYYKWNRPWYINNILGICFCLQGIEKFSLGTYKIGAILLVGLFFYDIFWVFGTDVMVTVAKNLDGPIKILFPRARTADGKLELSLLGLGDIVIPGFFLALLLRFDAHNNNVGIHYVNVHENFPKPYFHSALAGYVLGLGTTMFVMIQFQAAQPALLYLVPACLGSSFLCAIVRGEVKELLDYSEEQEELEEDGVVEGDEQVSDKPIEAKKDD